MKWGICYPEVCEQTINTSIQSLTSTLLPVTEYHVDDFSPVSMNNPGAVGFILFAAVLVLLGLIGMVV